MSVEALEPIEPAMPVAEETGELAEVITLPVAEVVTEAAAPATEVPIQHVAGSIAALRLLSVTGPNGRPLVTDQPAGLLEALKYLN